MTLKESKESRLKRLKSYLRVDFDDDDELLEILLDSAEEYFYNAGVRKSAVAENRLYELGIMIYVAAYYENRDAHEETKGFSYGLQSIISQLKDGL